MFKGTESNAVNRALSTLPDYLVTDFEEWMIDHEIFFTAYKAAAYDLRAAQETKDFEKLEIRMEYVVLRLIKYFNGWLNTKFSSDRHGGG